MPEFRLRSSWQPARRCFGLNLLGVFAAILLTGPSTSEGQSSHDETIVELARINGDIRIDGRVEESAWDTIDPLPLIMYEPVFEGGMTERSEIRIGYDHEFIYASGRFYDSEPDRIRANSMYRDRYAGDDTFSLFLDTFNDRQNAVWFAMNPNAVRMDYAIVNDLEGGGLDPFGRVINSSWNTYWDVATTRSHEGWFVEMRVPLSSLGFQVRDGIVEMGLATMRRISRKNELHLFPAIAPNWNMAFAKPSQFQRIRLRDVVARKPVYVTPYATSGASQLNELSSDESSYVQTDDFTADVGGDIKYSLTNNLTLDLTVNTDFAQAEVDDEQVNLTRFSLFFPEKRQFFQERAGIFEYRTSGRFDRLFHTRQIGLKEGQTVPIIGGARLVGRVGDWDIGAINLQTSRDGTQPSENFGVYRARKQVFNPNSYVGAIVTTRVGSDSTWNAVYGLDGIIRVGRKEYVELKWAQTYDEAYANRLTGPNGYARARLERRTEIGLSYTVSTTWGGADFDPGIGFVSRTGFVQPFATLGYGWIAGSSSPVLSVRPWLILSQYRRDTDGSLESGLYWLRWDLVMKSGDAHGFGLEAYSEDLLEPVEFPENTEVPVGRYRYYALSWDYEMRDGRLLRTNASASVGTFFDGTNIEVQAEPTWNLSRYLELGATYQFNRVRFSDRDQGFYVNLARVRAQIAFSTKASVNAFLQYNTATDTFSSNMRFRYNFREGNDLWIVFNEGRNTDRFRETPTLPELESRTVLLKYTYTFIR